MRYCRKAEHIMKVSGTRLYLVLASLFVFSFILGCGTLIRTVPAESGHYYIPAGTDFSGLGKVVVLEFDDHSNVPDLSLGITGFVTQSLQKHHLFSVSCLSRLDPAWRSLDLENSLSYSLEDLGSLGSELKADGVLFGTVTQYYPYPHMLIGLHLKLIDLRDGRLLWALEQVWDSTDKRVERRMRAFFDHQMRSGYEPMSWELLVTSPRAFKKFVAFEVAETFGSDSGYIRKI